LNERREQAIKTTGELTLYLLLRRTLGCIVPNVYCLSQNAFSCTVSSYLWLWIIVCLQIVHFLCLLSLYMMLHF